MTYPVLDYIRMFSYVVVILCCLRGIARRKFSSSLFAGDIIMAFALLVSALTVRMFEVSRTFVAQSILTAGSVFWAGVQLSRVEFDGKGE